AGLQQFGQVYAIALAAGQVADAFLLIAALEVEATDVGARRHFVVADLDDVLTAGDFFPHGFAGVELVAALIDVGQLHGFTDPQRAVVGRVFAGKHAEQVCFAGAVGTDDADDGALRRRESQGFGGGQVGN